MPTLKTEKSFTMKKKIPRMDSVTVFWISFVSGNENAEVNYMELEDHVMTNF